MAKTLQEAAITTRNSRSKLALGVHWKGIDPDVHLGYRKGKRGGVWLVRWRKGRGYRQAPLGTADDELSEGTLDYNAAVKASRRAVEEARRDERATDEGPVLTVRHVIEAYAADRDARDSRRKGRQVRSDASSRLVRHILGDEKPGRKQPIPAAPLADVALHGLNESDLLTWRSSLPTAMKAATKQRLINDLKAALNGAYATHRSRLDPMLPATIKHGLKTLQSDEDEAVPLARDNQILTDGQVGALLTSAREIDFEQEWEGDLFRLIVVLAATGARFSQVARMRVAGVQWDQGRLMVPVSRKGKGSKGGVIPMPVGKDVLDTLLPITAGRAKDDWLLERWRQKQVPGDIRWVKDERGPWRSSAELVRPWHAIRERVQMPGVIPYSLRHSSIVRGIRANLPIRMVASLHDTSVTMVERHYSKWITSGLEEMARAAIIPLVPQEETGKIVPIRGTAL